MDIAFQPIVNINTEKIFGVKALLRNYQDIDGYKNLKLFYNLDNRLFEMPDILKIDRFFLESIHKDSKKKNHALKVSRV